MTSKDFKIHSICVVKNEADIIQHCLQEASKWSDYIYVYDGQSTDGTWEKVVAMQSDKIIPWKQDGKVFQESLRGEVFNAFKDKVRPGDWWCHLDSDEFYDTSPKDFLASIKPPTHVVWGISIEYYLTEKDIESLDFSQSVSDLIQQIKYYKAENSEPRFFRHRDGLTWENGSWPKHMGLVNKERILYKHYKYRSPDQIKKRLATRVDNRSRGFPGWEHAATEEWKEKLVNHKDLNEDFKDGHYNTDYSKLPNHLETTSKRILKRLLHTFGVLP